MIDQDSVLRLIQVKGPVLPVHISKEIKQNLLFTSAILAELVGNKKLKMTHLKVGGGSPLYYLPGQEDQLHKFFHYLDDTSRKTAEFLEKKKVVRDSELGESTQKTLRTIKDFAIPLQVTIGDNKELFWKWHSFNQEESTNKIKELLGYKIPSKAPKQEKIEEKVPKKEIKEQPKPAAALVVPEKQASLEPERPTVVQQKEIAVPESVQETPAQQPPPPTSDAFLQKLQLYFSKSNIAVIDTTLIKKNKEYDFTLTIAIIILTHPSIHLSLFCHIRYLSLPF